MFVIAGMSFEGQLKYTAKTIAATVPMGLTEEQLIAIRDAKMIEIVNNEELVAQYTLVNWSAIEKVGNGIQFTWQTFYADDVDTMKQQISSLTAQLEEANAANEELTVALLELAEIIGGEEPAVEEEA